jgi:hypothetical protein
VLRKAELSMASTEIRDRRRVLRYRNLVVKQMAQIPNLAASCCQFAVLSPHGDARK